MTRWLGLILFLDGGRIEIDSNAVERTIRPLFLRRKNTLFSGSDGSGQHWAMIPTMIVTCNIVGVEPRVYLTDIIIRIIEDHPQRSLVDLPPWASHTAPALKAVA